MNWGEFRTRLQTWAKMADSSPVPWDDCMEMALDAIQRDIMFQALDAEVLIDPSLATAGDGHVYQHALPSDYNGVWRVTNNGLPLRRYQPDTLKKRGGRSVGSINKPFGYAVVGTQLWTAPGSGGENLRLIYHRKDSKPASDTETNIGLTEAPFAYLWAGLVAVHEFTGDDTEADRAGGKYQAQIDRVNELEQKKRLPGAGRAA